MAGCLKRFLEFFFNIHRKHQYIFSLFFETFHGSTNMDPSEDYIFPVICINR